MRDPIFVDSFFFCLHLFLLYCFPFLSAFLPSKSFRNNEMHSESTDRYVFFVEIQMKKENLKTYFLLKCNWKKTTWKMFFGRKSLGTKTNIPVSQTTWIRHCYVSYLTYQNRCFLCCPNVKVLKLRLERSAFQKNFDLFIYIFLIFLFLLKRSFQGLFSCFEILIGSA